MYKPLESDICGVKERHSVHSIACSYGHSFKSKSKISLITKRRCKMRTLCISKCCNW
uniref:Uncharacterized protein n=1 Tax=Anguilla anguilla TaxID=7936 RepID=A0A0E9WB32_ANGAN